MLIKLFPYEHRLSNSEFTQIHEEIINNIKLKLPFFPILQRANNKLRFNLNTHFSAIGCGFVLCQSDSNDPEAIIAMYKEDAGEPCLFDACMSKLCLFPVCFGSQLTTEREFLPFLH